MQRVSQIPYPDKTAFIHSFRDLLMKKFVSNDMKIFQNRLKNELRKKERKKPVEVQEDLMALALQFLPKSFDHQKAIV